MDQAGRSVGVGNVLVGKGKEQATGPAMSPGLSCRPHRATCPHWASAHTWGAAEVTAHGRVSGCGSARPRVHLQDDHPALVQPGQKSTAVTRKLCDRLGIINK